MPIYAIADPHLSFGSAKPMDLFPGWENHARRLEKQWRAVVGGGDTVVLPGDISWAMTLEQALPDFRFLHELPGTKVILKGNHDYWWSTRKKIEDFWALHGLDSLRLLHNNAILVEDTAICGSRGWFFDCGEAGDQKVLRREAGRLRASIQAGKKLCGSVTVFLHYPPVSVDRVCGEICQVLAEEGVPLCYYGHLHGDARRWAFQGSREGIHFELISADALRFCPKRVRPLPLRACRLSIITAFLNEEAGLAAAVDSVLAQSCPDWELILVDDGSTDGSGRAADEYARRDARIRVIHQPNGGLSAARNAGMAIARGEYIGFLDADDTLDPAFVRTMLDAALVDSRAMDAVHAPLRRVPLEGPVMEAAPPPEQLGVLRHEDILQLALRMQENSFFIYSCRSVFRRAFLEAHGLRFREELRFAEDGPFQLEAFCLAERVHAIAQAHYNYREKPGSMTNAFWRRTDALERFEALDSAKKELLARFITEPARLEAAQRSYALYGLRVFMPLLLRGAAENGLTYVGVRKILSSGFARFFYANCGIRSHVNRRALDWLVYWLAARRLYFPAWFICKYIWFRNKK